MVVFYAKLYSLRIERTDPGKGVLPRLGNNSWFYFSELIVQGQAKVNLLTPTSREKGCGVVGRP